MPGSIFVSVNPIGMAAGSYTGTVLITVSNAGVTILSQPISVTLTIGQTGGGPTVTSASPSQLTFYMQAGSGLAPAPQNLLIAGAGRATLHGDPDVLERRRRLVQRQHEFRVPFRATWRLRSFPRCRPARISARSRSGPPTAIPRSR